VEVVTTRSAELEPARIIILLLVGAGPADRRGLLTAAAAIVDETCGFHSIAWGNNAKATHFTQVLEQAYTKHQLS